MQNIEDNGYERYRWLRSSKDNISYREESIISWGYLYKKDSWVTSWSIEGEIGCSQTRCRIIEDNFE